MSAAAESRAVDPLVSRGESCAVDPAVSTQWRCACGTMLGELRARDVLIVIKAGSKRRRRIVASYPVAQSCPTCGVENRRDSR